MAFRLTWSPIARLDLHDLREFIADSHPVAAKQFIKSVFSAVDHLIDFPESGRIVPEFQDPTLREIIKKPCRIVYRVLHEQKSLEIVRVWHAARGIPEI